MRWLVALTAGTLAVSTGVAGAVPVARATGAGLTAALSARAGLAARTAPAVVPQVSRPLSTLAPAPATVTNGADRPQRAGVSSPQAFNGLGDTNSQVPSDSDIAVGPTAVFEIAEPDFQIFSLSGAALTSPAAVNTLWAGDTGPCASLTTGDWSQVIYDQLAGQFVYARTVHILGQNVADAYECLAVSQTDDPTGSWYLYTMPLSAGLDAQTDYPQLGFDQEAYYLGTNLWDQPGGSGTFEGDLLVAYNRSELLAGQPLQTATAELPAGSTVATTYESLTPATLEGQTPEPTGAPELFAGGPTDQLVASGGSSSYLTGFDATPDWSTGVLSLAGPYQLYVGPYNVDICPSAPNCGVQPGTTTELEAWSDNLMLPLVYRNFGTYQSWVGTWDVRSSTGNAAPEWAELRQYGSGQPKLYQEGVYSPTTASRYDQSITEDGNGDIVLAYTLSSSTIYPSIAGAVHAANMGPGKMSPEAVAWSGSASQTPSSPGLNPSATPSRWGDASYLALSPDGCTVWYSNTYYPSTTSEWQTEIVNLAIPDCTPEPDGAQGAGA